MDNKELGYRKFKHISIVLCLISLAIFAFFSLGPIEVSEETLKILDTIFNFFAHFMWGALCQYKAYRKGRNANLWGTFGFLFGLLPLVVLFFLPKAKRNRNEENNIPNMPF